MRHAVWPLAAAILAFACLFAHAGPGTRPAASTSTGATRPATAGAGSSTSASAVPQALLKRLDSLATPPDPSVAPERAVSQLQVGLLAILQFGEDAESNYPSATNLYQVRSRMLQAADMLLRLTGQRIYEKESVGISRRILAGEAPPDIRAQADWYVTRAKIRDSRLKDKEAADEIRKLAARYADSNAAAQSLAYATILARESKQKELLDELAGKLQGKYGAVPEIRDLLRRLDRHPDVGEPFEAELTRLDGTKLSLPKDLAGKVVVIDFWGTWCPTCVEEVPHMKQVYAKYAAKGVEFVGISVDSNKDAPAKFVQENKMTWIQTYDPHSPAAEKYGVEAFPSVWVVGRDGKVFSDDALTDLEKTLDKALAAAASAPASAPGKTK